LNPRLIKIKADEQYGARPPPIDLHQGRVCDPLITWAVYTRNGGLLHDIERRGATILATQPAE
jgi:hypothetical protein